MSFQESSRDLVTQVIQIVSLMLLFPVTLTKTVIGLFCKKKVQQVHTVAITGASSGIGEQLAYTFASNGTGNMLLTGRDANKLQHVANQCRIQGCNVVTHVCELSSTEEIEATVEKIKSFDNDVYGGIDVLVNCAGMSAQNVNDSVSTTEIFDSEFYHSMIHTNYVATVAISTSVLDQMKERKNGHIVLVSSINGMIGPAQQIIYNSTKHAILSFARDLFILGKKDNVGVTVVCPGFIQNTGMTKPQLENENAHWSRLLAGKAHIMAKKIYKSILRKDFFVTYPFTHFITTFIASSLPPSYWPIYSNFLQKTGVISKRFT